MGYRPRDPHGKLTPREREVLEQVVLGHSNYRISRRLRISEHTVKWHVAGACAKLGVDSRIRAAVLYDRITRPGGTSEAE